MDIPQPFDMHYDWNQAEGLTIYNESITRMNGFRGNVYQEATSGVTKNSCVTSIFISPRTASTLTWIASAP
jgi:hypothetical protein